MLANWCDLWTMVANTRCRKWSSSQQSQQYPDSLGCHYLLPKKKKKISVCTCVSVFILICLRTSEKKKNLTQTGIINSIPDFPGMILSAVLRKTRQTWIKMFYTKDKSMCVCVCKCVDRGQWSGEKKTIIWQLLCPWRLLARKITWSYIISVWWRARLLQMKEVSTQVCPHRDEIKAPKQTGILRQTGHGRRSVLLWYCVCVCVVEEDPSDWECKYSARLWQEWWMRFFSEWYWYCIEIINCFLV